MERSFDLVVVDAPLRDESGEDLSRRIASESIAQVIIAVKSEYYSAISAICGADGVLTVSKPMDKTFFWSTLALAKSTHARMVSMHAENMRLQQKIEDIRITDRAKCILISYMNMSEQEAHRFIEKQAMDMRSTKRAVAEGILRTYEN